jgi:hypothetical protein
LPKPKEPIVVGLYKFRDQTGQYKASENGNNFSTAVTQGATSILIKAKIQNGLCQLSVKILVIYFRKEILFVPQDKNIQRC